MLAINIDDVMNVLNTCKPYLIALAVVFVLAVVITIAVMKMQVAKTKFIRSQSWIAVLLALVVIVNMICWGPMSSMISLATGNGTITEETSAEATELCEDIAEEGIVLLQNEGNMLPMENGTKINVFGWSSTNPVYGGTGSGSLSDAAKEFSDTAVVVIARSGGEGADLPTSLDPSVEDTFEDGGTFGSSGLRYIDQKDDLDASKQRLQPD